MKKIKFCSRNITELLKIQGKLWHTHWKLENRNEEKLWKKWNVSKTNYLAQQGSVFITSSNMMAIFCVNLTGLRDTQIVVKCYFSVSLSIFPGEVNIWIRSLSKEGGPWKNGWTSSHRPEGLNRRVGEGEICSLLEPGHLSSPILRQWHTWLFGLSDLDWFTQLTPLFPGFRFRMHCIVGFPRSPACRQIYLLVSVTLKNPNTNMHTIVAPKLR